MIDERRDGPDDAHANLLGVRGIAQFVIDGRARSELAVVDDQLKSALRQYVEMGEALPFSWCAAVIGPLSIDGKGRLAALSQRPRLTGPKSLSGLSWLGAQRDLSARGDDAQCCDQRHQRCGDEEKSMATWGDARPQRTRVDRSTPAAWVVSTR